MAQIDFQSYMALFAAEMPRFSVPGIGSFVWHVERAQVDPKAGIVLPPRPILKYEPGHRYQAETVAFLQEYFGIPAEEAEALLREIGRIASSYIRATNEIDLWKLGKIKKVGAIYKVELAEDAPIAITAELYEVSLRSTAGAAVSPPPVSLPAAEKRKPEKPPKTQEKSKIPDQSRARVVESGAEGPIPPQPARSSERRWTLVIVVIGVIVAVAAAGVFWLLSKRKAAQPVEISLSKRLPSGTSSSETSDLSEKEAAPARPSEKSETAPAPSKAEPARPKSEQPTPQPKAQVPPPAEKPAPSPLPTTDKPKPAAGPRYHIIVGAYPSRAEAEAKAREFSGYAIQYLPGKEPGWVRLSVFSTTNKEEAQRKLQEIRAQAPDAWVLTTQ